jgi:hypothetical protein
MSLLFSKYREPNIEGFDVFEKHTDLSGNIDIYNEQLKQSYNKLVTPATPITADLSTLERYELDTTIFNDLMDKTQSVTDARISDEKVQIEQIKYVYFTGTIALVSLIIVIYNHK